MTQRDIAKDKDTLKLLMKKEGRLDPIFIAQYWISRYETVVSAIQDQNVQVVLMTQEYERLQARISELEALLHPNNRPDVVKRTAHDRMLETFFKEMEGSA